MAGKGLLGRFIPIDVLTRSLTGPAPRGAQPDYDNVPAVRDESDPIAIALPNFLQPSTAARQAMDPEEFAVRSISPVIEDRRTFRPEPHILRRLSTRPARFKSQGAPASGAPFFMPRAFASPGGVAVCVRRKIRREVMFAKHGGGRVRRGRRSSTSNVWCRHGVSLGWRR